MNLVQYILQCLHFELCTGEKAGFMDKGNRDWIPSIGLSSQAINSDENEFPDCIPNTTSDWDPLEFDHTVIKKETTEIQEIIRLQSVTKQ